MLSSAVREVMKALLVLLAALPGSRPTQTELLRSRLLANDRKRVIARSESAIGRTVGAYRLKKTSLRRSTR
jgi:hypothetical protein